MIHPNELKSDYNIEIANGGISTTGKVWDILFASYRGDIEYVKKLVEESPGLIYAQYNYTPPIHLAVREGHINLVKYLLDKGAYDPEYKTYPFLDKLHTIAQDRGYEEIAMLLERFHQDPALSKFKGDNGAINYRRSELQSELQVAIDRENLERTKQILEDHPGLVHDELFFWGEGIMMMPAKDGNREMLELLMSYGAKVPLVLKWAQEYYFKHYEIAAFLIQSGMDPQIMSWHHVRLLHDMAQKGNIPKAELLIKHGADINSLEEEYQSTPVGMAVRWGQTEMVEYLLKHGANPGKSGAIWSTPLEWARKKKHFDIEKILLSVGAE